MGLDKDTGMDMNRNGFDAVTRRFAAAGTRRDAVRAMAALGAAMAGARVATADAQEDVDTAGNRCKGKSCTEDRDCGKGLYCDVSRFSFTCQYRRGSKGKKGQTCCSNNQCKNNLVCRNKKCKRPNS